MHRDTARSERRGPLEKAKRRAEARLPRIAGVLAVTLTLMIGALIFLAAHTVVPQITRAPGTIIPLGSYTQIESLDGGVVQTVFVEDGRKLDAGDLIIELQNPDLDREAETLEADLRDVSRRIAAAEIILSALDQPEPLPSRSLAAIREDGFPGASARLAVYQDSQRIAEASIEQQRATLTILVDAVDVARQRAALKTQILDRTKRLFDAELITTREYQAAQDELDAMRALQAEAAVRLAEAENTLMLSEADRQRETLSLREEALREVEDLAAERARLEAMVNVVHKKRAALRMEAPVGGILQTVAFPNVGEVIEPGETLFEILPARQALVVEARIPNIDIGHVAPEQPVAVSVDTFDVRRFGKVTGRVASFSPVPLMDDRTGLHYFRAAIELDDAVVGLGPFERPLRAGMTVVAEMTTGEQSLIEYILKPVVRTLSHAFNER